MARIIAASIVFGAMAFQTTPVCAQGAVLEEIVVTARKRAETLEESPVSVRAFTAVEIEAAGIETPRDFINLTPNVSLVETQNAGNAFINVRGVSQARNSEMSVAVLVDGVLMANPAQFTQQLIDVQQIEVLRGPQGALYGRNAIGGAITITTQQPGDEFAGRIELGADSGPGFTVRGSASGPVGESDTLKFRATASYVDTDGYIDNTYLDETADPYKDLSGRIRLQYQPSDTFSADFRLSASQLDTQALYFVIAAEVDDTSLPVRVNNPGSNERDIYTASMKLEWETDNGTFTSITAFDDLEELLTGDQFNFVPREESLINFFPIGPIITALTGDPVADLSQTQYLEAESWSQEFRYISPAEEPLRWIVGAYAIGTDRYISTGNQVDRGNGVFPVYREPRVSLFVDPTDPSPQLSLLADAQDNFAWAVFGELAYDFSDTFEASLALRYDEDTRENTTLTQALYDPTGGIGITEGEVRKKTWDELQPKVTLRYKPTDELTVYGGFSRGFRSGGFNQSGVGAAVPEPGVEDLFEAQVADTFEVGVKSIFGGGRYSTALSVFQTSFDNAYFFFFDPTTSTQNLGGIPEVDYVGFEFETNARFNDYFDAYLGIGYTDSEIKRAADPADNGNQAPLVTELTLNVGGQFRYPLSFGDGNSNAVVRLDYQMMGDTWWDPGNISKRSPVNLIDFRVGVEMPDDWSVTLWAKNLFDEKYNAEFSPGPAPGLNFLWPAPPRRWGATFIKRF
ncbi:MAG: TonB-dependent receptor [Gammaproteobacteria bacterium]|nr:TonB-dependent receptor [Gammaproteobacteria bacterium]